MREYNLDSILSFGKNKGYSVKQVFQFEPTYLIYLIECHEDFLIDLSLFEGLPNPTPYIKRYETSIGFGAIRPMESQVKNALEFISKGGVIEEIAFKFSENHGQIMNAKRNGTYIVPEFCKPQKGVPVSYYMNKDIPRPKFKPD